MLKAAHNAEVRGSQRGPLPGPTQVFVYEFRYLLNIRDIKMLKS